jgi:Zn-dependent protease with chaperone function
MLPIPLDDLQAMADRLAEIAGVERPRVAVSSGWTPFVLVFRGEKGSNPHIIVDEWWFGATKAALEVQRESIEAIIAHEIAHVQQSREGAPTDGVEAEYDADDRAIVVLGKRPDQMIVALEITAAMAKPGVTTHATNAERVAQIRERWLEKTSAAP